MNLWDNVEAQTFPFSAQTRTGWMPFRFAIVVSNNPINFTNVHSLMHHKPATVTMHIGKVKCITAHNCDKPKWHSSSPSLSWKGKMLGLDIVSQSVPKKTIYWTKIANLVSYQLLALPPHIVGSMPFRFFMGHPLQNKTTNWTQSKYILRIPKVDLVLVS